MQKSLNNNKLCWTCRRGSLGGLRLTFARWIGAQRAHSNRGWWCLQSRWWWRFWWPHKREPPTRPRPTWRKIVQLYTRAHSCAFRTQTRTRTRIVTAVCSCFAMRPSLRAPREPRRPKEGCPFLPPHYACIGPQVGCAAYPALLAWAGPRNALGRLAP